MRQRREDVWLKSHCWAPAVHLSGGSLGLEKHETPSSLAPRATASSSAPTASDGSPSSPTTRRPGLPSPPTTGTDSPTTTRCWLALRLGDGVGMPGVWGRGGGLRRGWTRFCRAGGLKTVRRIPAKRRRGNYEMASGTANRKDKACGARGGAGSEDAECRMMPEKLTLRSVSVIFGA